MNKDYLLIERIKENNLNIDSLFIEKDNQINKIVETDNLHELRSCSKLLVSMAVGIAIDQKLFSIDEKVYPYIKKYISNKNNVNKIKCWTIKTLLTHTTGYDVMLMSNKEITEKQLDKSNLISYVLDYDIKNEVNQIFLYNNVEPFLISVIFKNKHNIDLKEYINEHIFKKINITNFEWENYGEYCPGCTGLYLKPEDFHKIGQLILNNGFNINESIVPENWIKQMCNLQLETPKAYKKDRVFPKIGIGYYIFISRDGYIFRDGTNGQYLILNKDKNLLISVMSSEKDMSKITEIFRDIY